MKKINKFVSIIRNQDFQVKEKSEFKQRIKEATILSK